jgi:hypothetical protein
MNEFTATPTGALASALALCALMGVMITWFTTKGARARAAERARIWGELKRPDWEARAARKRARRESGARADARLRVALMSAVALVALAATNLSAHATIAAIQRIGLTSIDAAVSAVIVFEAWLAILGALSLRHMTRGEGFNRYEAGVWAMASLMGVIAWWGGGSPIFALWPLLAAVAWHVVITFGRPHKPSALVTWWRLKRGKATSQDATTVMTERLITKIVNTGYAANVGPKLLQSFYARAFDRAWARADALGILTLEVRARIQTRIAARYVGARALAPEAVEHMNPWNERAHSARTVRALRPVSAPPAHVVEMSAHESTDERAAEDERASVSVPARIAVVTAHSTAEMIAAVQSHFDGPAELVDWVVEFIRSNGKLPTRGDLAIPAQKSPGHVARWMMPVRKELGLS